MNTRSRFDEPLDQRANRRLLDLLDPPDHHRAAARDPAENRRLFRRPGPPTPRPRWVSLGSSPRSRAICPFDRFSPMKYRHKIYTERG
jgi:hypothetical protein